MSSSNKPQHAPIPHFPLRGNEITVGGIGLRQLAARAGQTPFYALDRHVISARIGELRRHLPEALSLHYAMKANPHPAVVQHIARDVDGLDVASGRELRVALDTGTAAHDISFAGPGKSLDEMRMAIASGITLIAESLTQIEQAAALAQDLRLPVRLALRVNPDFELKSAGMKMGGHAAQFGIDAEIIPDVLKRVAELPQLDFLGFHIFWGSQNLRVENISDAQSKTFQLAYRLAAHWPKPLRMLNIGGGLGIPYFPGDTPLDLAAVGRALQPLVAEAQQKLPQAELMMELGRYIVGEAGVYVCKVLERKVSRGEVFLITDGGLHHHLAASGNFGQVIRKNYPVAIGNRMDSTDKETVNVVGPLCTPLDLLGAKMELPRAEAGDLIVVFHSGAYGLSASPRAFLSHPDAVEMLI